ncbi:hypothetical protein Tco_1271665 [Tanacetum coccineum]
MGTSGNMCSLVSCALMSSILLKAIMNQLYDVMYEFSFSLPPDYALVIRALGSLEGTTKTLDPEFKVLCTVFSKSGKVDDANRRVDDAKINKSSSTSLETFWICLSRFLHKLMKP